jgi:hypothetical protein
VRDGLHAFIEGTAADEIMIVSHIFDHAKRVRSYEIAADVRAELSQAGGWNPSSLPNPGHYSAIQNRGNRGNS